MATNLNPLLRRIVLPALALASTLALADCVNAYDDGYGAYGYNNYPSYDGSVYVGGTLYNGPLHYRDYNGRRQYWVRNNWRDGDRDRGDRGGDRDGRGDNDGRDGRR
jgi:hypothetical protein